MSENKIVLSLSLQEADQLRSSLVDYSNILDERSEILYSLALSIESKMLCHPLDFDKVSPETGAPSSESEV